MRRSFVLAERVMPTSRDDFARSRLTLPLRRFVLPRATSVVVNGVDQMNRHREVFGAAPGLTAIVNGRPVRAIAERARGLQLDRAGLRRNLGLPEDASVVVNVGRLAEQKDQRSLILAIGRLRAAVRPAHLVLVGDGPRRASLERLATEIAPGRVSFVGHQADPIQWLAAADVFAFPSVYEGLSGALVEALAAGVPCVATDIAGNRELVQHRRTGWLVPVNDPDALASALEEVIVRPEEASRLAAAGHDHVLRHYDDAREREAWRDLLRARCRASGRSAPKAESARVNDAGARSLDCESRS
jgi:glycosyltransferase involved in cell wall biosynthesis